MSLITEDIKRVIEDNKEGLADLLETEKVGVDEYRSNLEDQKTLEILHDTLSHLRMTRPVERGDRSRMYAITITEMEKVLAYFKTFVIDSFDR